MLADGRARLEDDAESFSQGSQGSPPNGSPPHDHAHEPHVAHTHLASSDPSNESSDGLPALAPPNGLGAALPQGERPSKRTRTGCDDT